MSTIGELARLRSGLAHDDLRHLERLVATWRPLADLSFADLLLHAPLVGEEAHRFVVLGQVRPVTGQTAYPQDMVSTVVDEVERPVLARCFRTGEIVEADATAIGTKDPVRITAIPVRSAGRLIAVVTRESGHTSARRPGELERTYLQVFDRFARMIADGSFPFAREEIEIEGAPRVGDGVIVTDHETRVVFASPNAVSSLHRMGIHGYAKGQLLAEIGVDDTAPKTAMAAGLPVAEEIERGDISILLHALPLLDAGAPVGAMVLIRDVTDLRRRDRMLLSKDATIREIHHRVKNNLQTIASLLRLQGRRMSSTEARAALAESERRIRSIAVVHETLSRDAGGVVRFSEIVRPLVRVVEETVASPDSDIRFTVEGDAGDVPGEIATPLAVVLNELMQNAVDHAFGDEHRHGTVRVTLTRTAGDVVVEVADDGAGLPDGFTLDGSKGLGLSIVHALVTGELGGSIEMRDNGGTSVHVRVPVAATLS
ncbi:MAG TPA: histidine kinase N-terminal domain-containing protein [Acidimicrobiia bacterium]|nr:histidine kinase N-terminal domain-containing protein [Acidimicrobiia bacterium]